MNLLILVWSFLKAKRVNTTLQVVLLGLGIGVVVMLLLFQKQVDATITRNTKGIDLVVGAKGSPLQLILCNVLHADLPTGNIKLAEAEALSKNAMIKQAVPLALGDSYKNHRIVGTTQAYPQLYQIKLKQGQWWQREFEVTVGSAAASVLMLKIGDTFVSAHGLSDEGHAHDEHKFKVVGILEPSGTVLDNLILTDIHNVWEMHEEHHEDELEEPQPIQPSSLVAGADAADTTREITSLLIRYRSPMAAVRLPRSINTETNMQAASPAFEVSRLFTLLGFGQEILLGFSIIIIAISALSIFIGLYNSLQERQYDLAMMRVMGASKMKVMGAILLEGIIMTLLALMLGFMLGHSGMVLCGRLFASTQTVNFSPTAFYSDEVWVALIGLALGFICSLLPASKAYRLNIHHTLSRS